MGLRATYHSAPSSYVNSVSNLFQKVNPLAFAFYCRLLYLGIDCKSNSELKLLIWTEEFHKNFSIFNHLRFILNIQIYVCVFVCIHDLYFFMTEKSLNAAFNISSLFTGKVDPM